MADFNEINARVQKKFQAQQAPAQTARKISISVDPTTREINIAAPQAYLDSEEFKTQVLPQFESLKGRTFNENEAKSLINSDMLKDLETQVNDIMKRSAAINTFKRENKGTTDKDAMVYFQNLGAASRSDTDEQTQVTLGFNEDGTPRTQSLKGFLSDWKSVDQKTLARAVKKSVDNLNDEKISPTDKAITKSLLGILTEKGVTKASDVTKLNLGLSKFLAENGAGFAGQVFNFLTKANLNDPGKGIIDQAKDRLENDPTKILEGAQSALDVGGGIAAVTSIGSDLVATQGRNIPTALGKIPIVGDAGRAIIKGAESIPEIARGGGAAVNTIKQIPNDIAFGLAHSAADPEYDGVQDFAVNVGANAALFGGAKVLGTLAKNIDTASGGALSTASLYGSKAAFRTKQAFTDLPGIGNVVKKFTANFIDENAPIRRAYGDAIGQAKGAKAIREAQTEYQEASNAIRTAAQRGAPEARAFRASTPEYGTALDIGKNLRQQGDEVFNKASQYVDARTTLERVNAGQYGKVSDDKIADLQRKVDDLFTEDAESYRQALAASTAKITELGTRFGILDADIIDYMNKNPEFAKEYIHLQRDLNLRDNPYIKGGSARNLKASTPVRRLKGVSDTEVIDPFLTMEQRLQTLTRMAAENKVALITKQGIESGTISGRVIADAGQIKAKKNLEFDAKVEKDTVGSAIAANLEDITTNVNRLIDDVEDFAGSGQIIVQREIEQSVDNLIDDVIDNPALESQMVKLMDEVGNGREGAEMAAGTGIIYRQRKQILDAIENSLVKGPLGADERKSVVDTFERTIMDRFEAAAGNQDLTLKEGQQALNARSREIRELNADIAPSTETRTKNTVAYYDQGQKGFIELDDPALADYFNSRKTMTEDGVIAKIMTQSSRLFRAGTTGSDPVFVLFVNPVRDIPQAAVTSGVNVLSPANLHRTVMELNPNLSADEIARIVARADEARVAGFKGASFTDVARGDEAGKRGITNDKKMGRTDKRTYRMLEDESRARTTKGKVINALIPRRALRNIEAAASSVEYATRSQIYNTRFEAALKRGASTEDAITEALFYGSEATANFYNVGSHMRQIVRTIPYLSAAINGKASFARIWALDPVGVTMRMLGGVAMPSMVLAANNLADPEKAEGYYQIPEYTRRTNIIVMLDKENWIEIPISYELATVFNPFREYVETQYDMDPESISQTLFKGLLGASPIDLSGFAQEDFEGNIDYGRAAAQAASTFLPQAVRPGFEAATGNNLYTGSPLNPSDADLYQSGAVNPGEAVTAGDRTNKGSDSLLLRRIADVTGVDQGKLQSLVSNYTGTVGSYVLNTIDKLAGADESQQGGREIGQQLQKRFFGKVSEESQIKRDYYAGINRLEGEKELLQNRLEKLSQDQYFSEGTEADSMASTRQDLIDEFGQKVSDFADNFGEYYQRVGGFKPYQTDSLIKLLDLGPSQGAFDNGSYQAGELQDARNESRAQAVRRGTDLGLPTTNDRDLFGRTFKDNAGETYQSFDDTTLANDNIRNRRYGAPKQIAYEFAQIVKANKKQGVDSLYDVKSKYDDQISTLYDSLANIPKTDKAATNKVYESISALQEEYMKEFDKRIRPLVDQYGVDVLSNSKVFDELSTYIVVPNDLTPFASKKKQPYLKDDARAYLEDRYGVGKINKRNLETDSETKAHIERINSLINQGQLSSANYQLSELEQEINAGETFVDDATMNTIEKLIKAMNKR